MSQEFWRTRSVDLAVEVAGVSPAVVYASEELFNQVGMTDELAMLLATFAATRGDPEATSALLDYVGEYLDKGHS